MGVLAQGVLKKYTTLSWAYVTPHQNWQGDWNHGSFSTGALCLAVGATCPSWPGDVQLADNGSADLPTAYTVWWGTLLQGGANGSGLQYLRNRYYDPARGRFTQPDPIGLGGGMNLYGFASGDPVNFSDPMGLCTRKEEGDKCTRWQQFTDWAYRKTGSEGVLNSLAATGAVLDALSEMLSDPSAAGPGSAAAGGAVVIGETMERVKSFAKAIGADWYKARGLNPAKWMRNNAQWLRRAKEASREIIDIGVDPSRTERSLPYAHEKRLLDRWKYPTTYNPQP